MNICRAICLLISVHACLSCGGCGGDDEVTTIQPTETYQPTEQERRNQKFFDSMREQRD